MKHGLRLPMVGEATERILEDFAEPLLRALSRAGSEPEVVEKIAQAARALRDVQHARELCQRLLASADARLLEAEVIAEEEIGSLFAALSGVEELAVAVFPSGLGAALSPKASAQVREGRRQLAVLEAARSAPPAAREVAARLVEALDTLAQYCADYDSLDEQLEQTLVAEHRQQRAFRKGYHEAFGVILSGMPDQRAAAVGLFDKQGRAALGSRFLPEAPPPTPEAGTKSSTPLSGGRGSRSRSSSRRAR